MVNCVLGILDLACNGQTSSYRQTALDRHQQISMHSYGKNVIDIFLGLYCTQIHQQALLTILKSCKQDQELMKW